MMNRIGEKILIIILMILIFILGFQYVLNRKKPEENTIENDQQIVTLEEISTAITSDSIYNGQSEQNAQKLTLAGNSFFAGMEAYKDILAEYELAQRSSDETYMPEQWKYVDQQMFYVAKENLLYYSLADLAGNSHPKLIIGTIMTEPAMPDHAHIVSFSAAPLPEGTAYYCPWYIYSYEEDGIQYIERGGSQISIYEDGIIEMSRSHYAYYYQYQKDSGELDFLDYFKVKAEIQDDEVKSRSYYRSTEDDSRNDEISENEYWEYMEQYTSKPMELEWMPIEGFLGESIMSGNRYFDETQAYRKILAEYGSAQISTDEIHSIHKSENASDLLFHIAKERTLYYSLADLTGDGHMELVMGVVMEELQETDNPLYITPKLSERSAGTKYYDPWVIYSYNEVDGIVRSCERGAYGITIYEEGIVEMTRAWHTYYYQYQKDSGELVFLDHFRVKPEIQDSKVISRTYYRITQDESCDDEISESEYWECIKQYASKPMELEWMPVEGGQGV